MVFTIYGHGGHLGHMTWTIYIDFRFPFLCSLALIGQAVSKKIFEIVYRHRAQVLITADLDRKGLIVFFVTLTLDRDVLHTVICFYSFKVFLHS